MIEVSIWTSKRKVCVDAHDIYDQHDTTKFSNGLLYAIVAVYVVVGVPFHSCIMN